MPETALDDIQSLWFDPDFNAASEDDRLEFMRLHDPAFSRLRGVDQRRVVRRNSERFGKPTNPVRQPLPSEIAAQDEIYQTVGLPGGAPPPIPRPELQQVTNAPAFITDNLPLSSQPVTAPPPQQPRRVGPLAVSSRSGAPAPPAFQPKPQEPVIPPTKPTGVPRDIAKPGPYVTLLSPQEEAEFRSWVQQNNVPFDPSPQSDYDMRGFWRAQKRRDPKAVFDGQNYPDQWKTPANPTFSSDSMYAGKDAPKWMGSKLVDSFGNILKDEAAEKEAAKAAQKQEKDQQRVRDDLAKIDQKAKDNQRALDEKVSAIAAKNPEAFRNVVGMEKLGGNAPGVPMPNPSLQEVNAPSLMGDIGGGLARGAASAAMSIPRAVARIPGGFQDDMMSLTPTPPNTPIGSIDPAKTEALQRQQFANLVNRTENDMLPAHPVTGIGKFSEAFGSTVPYLAAGVLGGAPAAGALGIMAGVDDAMTRADQSGIPLTDAQRSAVAAGGAAIGSTEALPLGRLFARLKGAKVVADGVDETRLIQELFPTLKQYGKSAGVQALEEGAQEAGSGLAQDALEASYGGRPVSEIGSEFLNDLTTGGGVGALLDVMTKLMVSRAGRAHLRRSGIDPDALREYVAQTPDAPTPVTTPQPEAAQVPSAPRDQLDIEELPDGVEELLKEAENAPLPQETEEALPPTPGLPVDAVLPKPAESVRDPGGEPRVKGDPLTIEYWENLIKEDNPRENFDSDEEYNNFVSSEAKESLNDYRSEREAEEKEKEEKEKFFSELNQIDETVDLITAELENNGLEYQVGGRGTSKYVRVNGYTIRVSNHAPPHGRGGLREDGTANEEANFSIHPGGPDTIETAIRGVLTEPSDGVDQGPPATAQPHTPLKAKHTDKADAAVNATERVFDASLQPSTASAPALPPASDIAPTNEEQKQEEEKPREFSSTQANFPVELAAQVQNLGNQIADEDLAENGREDDTHVTVKFGIHGNDPAEVARVLEGEPPIEAKLGKVSLFQNEDADVVKIEVESEDLHRLNKKIADSVETTDTHPTYKPHVTIAYVKPGLGQKYVEKLNQLEGTEVTLGAVAFSGKDRSVTEIPLVGTTATEQNENAAPAPASKKRPGGKPAPVTKQKAGKGPLGLQKKAKRKQGENTSEAGFAKADLFTAPIVALARRLRGKNRTSPDPAFKLTGEVEERFQKGGTANQEADGISDRLKELYNGALGWTRTFQHLPREKYGDLIFQLGQILKSRNMASTSALLDMAKVVGDLSFDEFEVLRKAVIIDDMIETLELYNEAGEKIPDDLPLAFGWTPETLRTDQERVKKAIEDHPKVAEALERRREVWDKVKADYLAAMRAAGADVEGKLKRKNYFRHRVLLHQRMEALASEAIRTPKGRGFLKRRQYSAIGMDFASNFIQTEMDVIGQLIADTRTAKFVSYLDKKWNIRKDLEAKAKQHNIQATMPHFQALADLANLENPGGKQLTADDMFRRTLNRDQAIALDAFGKLAADGQLPAGENSQWADLLDQLAQAHLSRRVDGEEMDIDVPGVIKYAAWALKQKSPSEAKQPASLLLKGIQNKRAQIKQLAGDKYKDWDDFIPDGFKKFAPDQTRAYYQAYTVPEHIAMKLMEENAENMQIGKDDIRKVFARGAAPKEMVLDENIVKQFEAMQAELAGRRQRTELGKAARAINAKWKQYVLLSPARAIKYTLRNQSGDLDSMLAGLPWGKAIKTIRKDGVEYQRELAGFFKPIISGNLKDVKVSPRLERFLGFGAAESTLATHEIGEQEWIPTHMAELDAWEKNTPPPSTVGRIAKGPLNAYANWVKHAEIANTWRELANRYTVYNVFLNDLNENKGRPTSYAASNREEVDAIEGNEAKAYRMSNDLMGAYDEISRGGRALRSWAIPFWSYQETNFKRYFNLVRNAAIEGGTAQRLGSMAIGKVARAPYYTYKIGSQMFKFYALWSMFAAFNGLFFEDDDEKLQAGVRRRPHLTFGGNDTEVYNFPRLGNISDILEWIDLEESQEQVRQAWNGRIGWGEALWKSFQGGPLEKLYQSSGPLVKYPFEALTGNTYFPDVTRPRFIESWPEKLATEFSLGEPFKALAGRPQKATPLSKRALDLVIYRVDPKEMGYYDTLDMARAWNKSHGNKGKGSPIGEPDRKTMALRDIKRSMRAKDNAALNKYMMKYLEAGGTVAGFNRSMASTHPLYGIKTEDRAEFVKSLSAEDRRRLSLALDYHEETFLNK